MSYPPDGAGGEQYRLSESDVADPKAYQRGYGAAGPIIDRDWLSN